MICDHLRDEDIIFARIAHEHGKEYRFLRSKCDKSLNELTLADADHYDDHVSLVELKRAFIERGYIYISFNNSYSRFIEKILFANDIRENAPDIGQAKCFFISASVIRSLRYDDDSGRLSPLDARQLHVQQYELDESKLLKTIVDDNIVD